MSVDLPREAMVVRFRPSNPEDVLRWAEKEHRRQADPARPDETFYRISVFADVKAEDESDDDLLRRLVTAAGLSGLDISKNRNCWTSTSGSLQDLGLTFWKDGDVDEVPEHYSLDLGSNPTVARVDEVLGAFVGPERTPT